MPKARKIPDDGPLWSEDSVGNYWLMFPNKHALTIEKIREIFSQFGTVRNITKAGDEKGLRFIQYTNLEDTERAVNSLKDHPTVSLRPYRPQKTQKSKAEKENNVQNERKSPEQSSESSYQKNMFQRKKPTPSTGPESRENQSENNNYSTCNDMDSSSSSKDDGNKNLKKNSESQKLDEINYQSLYLKIHNATNSVADVKDENCNKSESFSTNLVKLTKMSDVRRFHKSLTRTDDSSADVGGKSDSLIHKFNSLSPNTNKANFDVQKISCETSSNSVTPSCGSRNNSTNNCDLEDDDDMPNLVMKEKIVIPKTINLNASEVIVGNIDSYFGPGYLLHLFANYEPIAVSYINITRTGLRYCYVYFKNVQDSEDVEKRFDMHKLAGKRLIVMRPCQLKQEAGLV